MKFNVDIECTPEEARAFFGLPDVKPLQEALLSEVEDRLRATLKAMDPEAMLNTWLPATLKGFEQLQEMFLSQLGSLGKRNSSEYLTFYQALVAAAVAGRGYRSIRRAFRGSRRHGISGALPGWVDRERAHWLEHGFGQWVVEIPGEASFIGVVGLETVSYEAHFTPAVEVAWRLARLYWGKGYAAAAQASLDYGFEKLGLAEIVALTVPANLRSRRVMERLGMTRAPEDDFDHPRLLEGPLKRHILYRLRNPRSGMA